MKERTGAREGDTRAPFFLAPTSSKRLLPRLVRVPREGARGGDSESSVSSVPRLRCTPSRCITQVRQVSLIKRAFYFATKLNNEKSEQNPKYICHIAEQN